MSWDFDVPAIQQRFGELYVCAQCGGRVVFPWDLAHGLDGKTPVCGQDRSHSGFILASTWARRQTEGMMERMEIEVTYPEFFGREPTGTLDELFG